MHFAIRDTWVYRTGSSFQGQQNAATATHKGEKPVQRHIMSMDTTVIWIACLAHDELEELRPRSALWHEY